MSSKLNIESVLNRGPSKLSRSQSNAETFIPSFMGRSSDNSNKRRGFIASHQTSISIDSLKDIITDQGLGNPRVITLDQTIGDGVVSLNYGNKCSTSNDHQYIHHPRSSGKYGHSKSYTEANIDKFTNGDQHVFNNMIYEEGAGGAEKSQFSQSNGSYTSRDHDPSSMVSVNITNFEFPKTLLNPSPSPSAGSIGPRERSDYSLQRGSNDAIALAGNNISSKNLVRERSQSPLKHRNNIQHHKSCSGGQLSQPNSTFSLDFESSTYGGKQASVSPKNRAPGSSDSLNTTSNHSSEYFAKLTLLTEPSRTEQATAQVLKCSRKLLFAFSELYNALKKFTQFNNSGHTKTQEKFVTTLLISRKKIHKLAEALESCESDIDLDSLSFMTPRHEIIETVLTHVVNSVVTFRKLACLVKENLEQLTKSTDVCFLRMLILSVFGCFNEIYNASVIMKPATNNDTPPIDERIYEKPVEALVQPLPAPGKFHTLTKPIIQMTLKSCRSISDILSKHSHSHSKSSSIQSLICSIESQCLAIISLAQSMNVHLPDYDSQNGPEGGISQRQLSLQVTQNIELLKLIKQMMTPGIGDQLGINEVELRNEAAKFSKVTKNMINISGIME
ncbi:hypothetical protein DASC09_062080 [Saccharomycopsis crataegensis]|uniref:Uncharacterized protein n=1 Tax=Saccharomycopsis crataegensis TaxID=43959 RepID=A0AAV5QVP0_9ASCO|nr:hypothetical protein DASC09_062080 [Saccharomycopsis crataegensis]